MTQWGPASLTAHTFIANPPTGYGAWFQGQVRYRLKTPYRDGTTHLVLEPVDFMARLAALVPPPGMSEMLF